MMSAVALDDAGTSRSTAAQVETLFRSEYAGLVRLASLLLGERGAAEEVVQDAFVKLQIGWGHMRDREKAPSWLRSVVLNGARSRLRRAQVQRRHLQAAPAPAPSAELGAVATDEHRRVMAALGQLPRRQREALILKFYLDLSETDTAAAMGVSVGSVKTHVHRGLAALQSLIEREEDR